MNAPQTFHVKASVPMTLAADASASNFAGAGDLELTPSSVALRVKRLTGTYDLITPWDEIRDLNFAALNDKLYFSADFGGKGNNVPLRIGIDRNDVSTIQSILSNAPATARCAKCPQCAGPVADKKCQACGKDLSAARRSAGVRDIMIGSVVLLLGLGITGVTYYISKKSEGNIYVLCYGAIATGAALLVRGLIRTVTAAR